MLEMLQTMHSALNILGLNQSNPLELVKPIAQSMVGAAKADN
jgi:hypothetical protein